MWCLKFGAALQIPVAPPFQQGVPSTACGPTCHPPGQHSQTWRGYRRSGSWQNSEDCLKFWLFCLCLFLVFDLSTPFQEKEIKEICRFAFESAHFHGCHERFCSLQPCLTRPRHVECTKCLANCGTSEVETQGLRSYSETSHYCYQELTINVTIIH